MRLRDVNEKHEALQAGGDSRVSAAFRAWLEALAVDPEAATAASMAYEALDAADPESKGFAALCTVALGIVKTFHSEIPADTEIPQAIQTAALKFMERPARRGGDA